MKYNLIIVDDHKMFLDGLKSILSNEEEYKILLAAKDGTQIVKYLEINTEEKVDLMIMDISMPEMDGITLYKLVKQYKKNIKVLVVSMHMDADRISTLIENGVSGYVPKNSEKYELLKAIKSILEGEKYFSSEVKDIYVKSKLSNKKTEEIKLTKREIEVITLIAQEYTTQEIADRLFISKHTVESYRKNLMTKLNVRNIAGLTKYALRMNYIKA